MSFDPYAVIDHVQQLTGVILGDDDRRELLAHITRVYNDGVRDMAR